MAKIKEEGAAVLYKYVRMMPQAPVQRSGTGFLQDIRTSAPMCEILGTVYRKSVPVIRYHPFYAVQLKHVRALLRAVGNLFSQNLPMVQITADGCIGSAFLFLILIPHLILMRGDLVYAGVNHPLGIQIYSPLKFPVPQIVRGIMQHLPGIFPISRDTGNIRYIHMVTAFRPQDFRRPEGIVPFFNIQAFQGSSVKPFSAVLADSDADFRTMYPGNSCGSIRGPSLRIKKIPLFFFPVPDNRGVCGAVINRIPE